MRCGSRDFCRATHGTFAVQLMGLFVVHLRDLLVVGWLSNVEACLYNSNTFCGLNFLKKSADDYDAVLDFPVEGAFLGFLKE